MILKKTWENYKMKNSGHTPGPWHIIEVASVRNQSQSDYLLANKTPHIHGVLAGPMSDSDLALISAAPEMLAALEAALDTIGIDSVGPMSNHLLTVRKQVLIAIKKAKGE